MNSLVNAVRHFARESHIRNVMSGEWTVLVDDAGHPLPGIRGRAGVALPTLEGVELGADLIEMEPGSAFPLHTHAGEHILYVVKGEAYVHVDGIDHAVQEGDTVFVPAEYVHGVKASEGPAGPLLLLAIGYPHKPLDSPDRMRVVAASSDGNWR